MKERGSDGKADPFHFGVGCGKHGNERDFAPARRVAWFRAKMVVDFAVSGEMIGSHEKVAFAGLEI
jgi:hypothetical protein